MKQAFSERDRGDMLYLVLTLDPSAWTGAGWEGPARERVAGAVTDKHAIQAAYKHLVQCWTAFRRMLRDRYSTLVQKSPRKWERPVIEYVCTVEAHRSGWPHLNVVLVAPDIAREAKRIEDGADLKSYSRKAKGREVARRMFSRELRDSGFGRIAFVEPALPTSDDGGDRLAAYLLKLSGADGVAWDGETKGGLVDSLEGRQVAEIAKLTQVPYVAPKNFRRLRSSPKFLPPAHKGDGEWTGGIYNRETGQALRANRFAGMPELAAKAKSVGGKAERSIREYISHAMDRYRDVVGDMKPAERADLKLAISIINGEGGLPEKRRRVDYPVATETCDLVTSLEKLKAWIGEPGPGLDRTARVYKLKRFRG